MSNQEAKEILAVQRAADLVADELDADVMLYSGPIERDIDRRLIEVCAMRRKRKNVLLMLVTTGGDADAAYRIARCLQGRYERFTLYVPGYCKSAGTLIALGAHELVISDHGELGPLDVQMIKQDDMWEMQSGLTVMDTLTALKDNAFEAFEKFFLDIIRKSDGAIALRTAAQIATDMATGIFAPLYGQVNPLHIGEAGRKMSIAGHYGNRLLMEGGNIDLDELNYITSAYPSHGFVIDRREAQGLFRNVRQPSKNETVLEECLGDKARWPSVWRWRFGDAPPFNFLATEPSEMENEGSNEREASDGTQSGGTPRSGLGDSAEDSGEKPAGVNGNRESIPTSEVSS